MNPLKKRLKELTTKAKSPQMLMGMLKPFLPQIKEFAAKLNQSEEEGGLLKSNETQATLVVDFNGEEPSIYVGTLGAVDGLTVIHRLIDVKDLVPKNE